MLDERDLQAIAQLIDSKLGSAVEKLDSRMTGIDVRLETLDTRMTGIDGRLESLDTRVTGIDGRLETLDTRVTDVNGRLDSAVQRLENKIEESARDTKSEILAYIEADVMPKFDILADGHKILRETLSPKDRVEALEEEVSFMKQVIKALSQEVNELKMAQ